MQENNKKENQSPWRGSTFPLFFLLAVFNIVGIVVSLYVTHRFEGLYESAAQSREAWNQRKEGVEALRDLAMKIDGPPNNVFLDHDVPLESARLEATMQAFSDRLQIERREVRRTLSPQNAALLLAGFDIIEEKTARITASGREVFVLLRTGDWNAGARQMAITDRLSRGLGPTIGGLSGNLQQMETISVQEAGAQAARLRRLELLVASLFGLLMIAVAANGYKVARQTMMDLTARKRAETEMAELSRRNEMILDAAGDGIFGVDLEGRATFLNPAASRMTGFTFEQVRDETVHRTVHRSRADGTPMSLDECPSCRAMQRGETIDPTEGFFSRADGTALPVEYTTTPMRDELGKLLGAVVTFRDVSERHAIQKLKDEFVSVVSHELRTPLTSIRGALGLLAGGLLGKVTEKGQRMLDIAVSNTDRLVRLINDILDIERMDSGRITLSKEMCDAAEVMGAAADLMRPLAEKAGLTLDLYAEPAEVWADPDRLQQTFTNLLGNAIKFSSPGACIVFRAVLTPNNVTFEVRDTGRGIPSDKLQLIFERFQQVDASDSREKGGSGLGLAICRSIVNQHGGEIWAESEPGLGSRFFVSLPLVKTTAPILAEPDIRRSAKSVFLCDDDPSYLEVMQLMLEQKGYDVSVFESGRDLLRMAKARQPDIILLDLLMPEMNGWEVMARLKSDESTAHIPIVIVSVMTPEDAAEVAGWVQKPPDATHLLRTLDRALHLDGRMPRIMLVEDDDDLARVIAASFERHGIKTFHARTGSEAIDLARRLDPDLLVLDLVLPGVDGFGVIEWLKEHDRLRSVPLVVYSAAEPTQAERDRLRLGPTLFFTKSRIPPHEFEERVINLLNSITTAEGAVAGVH